MKKVIMTIFMSLGLLVAVTTGVATSGESNTVMPEKKPFTLDLKTKANSVQNWIESRPDAVQNWVADTKEFQKNQWAEGKQQTADNWAKIKFFFLGESN